MASTDNGVARAIQPADTPTGSRDSNTDNMPRMARVVLPGVPLHVTQRGVRRFDVFLDEVDRATYIQLLGESCRRFHLRIAAYCLMTNHVHFVAIPERPDSLARTFHRCHGVYATKFNMRRQSTGHLWQARPFSCPLDEEHLWAAIRYVERNPVRAKMVDRAEDFPWSSAAAHCGLRDDVLIDGDCLALDRIRNWAEWLALDNDGEVDQRIRERTYTGRPCGDAPFVREAEQALGRMLTPRKPGPKPKPSAAPEATLWTEDEIRF